MQDSMRNPSSGERDYECIDPGLGEQIWRIDDPATPPDLSRRLVAHVRHCADCRLHLALTRDLAAGLRDGTLAAEVAAGSPAWARWTGGLGGLALAACLALVFLLPPAPAGEDRLLRGADAPAVTAPVPDAVILDRTPVVRWTPVERATRYRVSVREVGGDFAWSAETSGNEIAVPAAATLPRAARLRVDVEPVPAHLVRGGRLQSSFRTGGWNEFLGFRLQAAPAGLLVGAIAGLAGLLAGGLGVLRHRP